MGTLSHSSFLLAIGLAKGEVLLAAIYIAVNIILALTGGYTDLGYIGVALNWVIIMYYLNHYYRCILLTINTAVLS